MQGWISLHRKIRQNPVFNDLQLLRLWIICLTEASHKVHETLVGKQKVTLEPGQFVTGRFDLHSMYTMGLKKKDIVSEKTVWRWLETLQELEFLTINSTNKFSLITLVKWTEYQSFVQENDQQMTNKRPTDDQQMTTNNNGNKGNKGNKQKEYIPLEDMDHVKITQKEFDKLAELLGDEEKVMTKLYYYASWILRQDTKKQQKGSPYLSIMAWHKKDLEKQQSLNAVQKTKDELKSQQRKAQMEATFQNYGPDPTYLATH